MIKLQVLEDDFIEERSEICDGTTGNVSSTVCAPIILIINNDKVVFR